MDLGRVHELLRHAAARRAGLDDADGIPRGDVLADPSAPADARPAGPDARAVVVGGLEQQHVRRQHRAAGSVSYYTKGEVADSCSTPASVAPPEADVARRRDGLAYKRYAGERGFTPDAVPGSGRAGGAATNSATWFGAPVGSTEELDYGEALDWFGLRFASPDSPDPVPRWKLEVREDATAEQKAHLAALLSGVPASR